MQKFFKKISLPNLSANEHAVMIFMAIIVGILGGYGAVLFRWMIWFFQKASFGNGAGNLLSKLMVLPWYERIIPPIIGGAVVGLIIYFFAKEAKGHGVPEVMEAVALKGGIIRKRVVLIKSLASAICIGTGGSAGREGPIVQIGSGVIVKCCVWDHQAATLVSSMPLINLVPSTTFSNFS